MNKLQICIVAELEKCPDPTPANIMDSVFNFIKRVTPCENVLAESAAATGTQSNASHVGALIVIAILSTVLSFVTNYNFIPVTIWIYCTALFQICEDTTNRDKWKFTCTSGATFNVTNKNLQLWTRVLYLQLLFSFF